MLAIGLWNAVEFCLPVGGSVNGQVNLFLFRKTVVSEQNVLKLKIWERTVKSSIIKSSVNKYWLMSINCFGITALLSNLLQLLLLVIWPHPLPPPLKI